MVERKRLSQKTIATHLHRRILVQLVLFVVIAVVLFGIVLVDALTSHLALIWIVVGAILGGILGYVVGHAFKLHWHEDSQKVIMSVDRTGFLIIVLYVLVRALTNTEAAKFVSGIELIAVTYAFLGGIMVGRIASMSRRIVRILRDNV